MEKRRNVFRYISFIMSFIMIFSIFSAGELTAKADEFTFQPGMYAVNVNTSLRLRSEPGTNGAILDSLPNGTVVYVTEVNGSWGKITYNGKTGWISLEYTIFRGDTLPHTLKRKVIDVSYYQGNINWNAVKADGVEAAILRIGVRYTRSKEIGMDTKFLEYYEGATKAGIPVGVYFYSVSLNVQQALDEADFVITALKNNNIVLEYPVFYDIEDKNIYYLGKEMWTAMSNAFMTKIEEAGYYAGIYTSKWHFETYIDPSILVGRAVWVAEYTTKENTTYKGDYGMWQYSNTGRVNGINGYVDMNWCYVDWPSFIKKNGYNGFEKQDENTYWDIISAPTHEKDGERILIDKKTGKAIKGELIPRLKYRASEPTVVKQPTAAQDGLMQTVCLDTGVILGQTPVPSLNSGPASYDFGTDEDWIVQIAPTCETAGRRIRYAKNSGGKEVIQWEFIAPIPHEAASEKTVGKNGNTEARNQTVCKHCGAVIEYTPHLLYDFDLNSKVDAADARIVLRIAAKLDKATESHLIASGGDKINPNLARTILRRAAKLD